MKTIKDNKTGAFIDQDCTIEHNGMKFTSGGAWLCQRKDTGKFEGLVYVTETISGDKNQFRDYHVTNWHGDIKIHCITGKTFYSNFGDRRKYVWFKYNDRYFYGLWCSIDWNQSVYVKEMKPWS